MAKVQPMHRALLLALLVVASAAQAQERPRAPRLFITPAGEPFRGPDGLAAWFARADADHDGRLTLAEFEADALRFFRTLDVNGDGRIDGFEAQAYERDIAPEITGAFFAGGGRDEAEPGDRPHGARPGGMRRTAKRPDEGRRAPQREGAGRFSLLDIAQPVANADRDVDGSITLAEWKQTAAIRFELLDKAKAGYLTPETLPPLPGTAPPPVRKR